MTLRTERIGEQIRAEIARVLREDVTDPRLRLVTVTRVDVAPDLTNALIYWSALDPQGGDPSDEVGPALDGAAGFVRRELAHRLPLRRTPELRFRHDPSLALGGRTLAVLRSLEEEGQDEPEGEA